MSKKISVIVAIYNVDEYLVECIESIIRQTYKNIEIILVDDGSEDTSGKICDEFASKDNRIVVVHKENGGLVSARKAGLQIASGAYIGFVDGDDYIEPDMYEVLIQMLESTSSDMVHSGYYESNKREVKLADACLDVPKNRNSLVRSILCDDGITPSIWSKVFKREVIQQAYQEVEDASNYGEDMVCLLAVIFLANRMTLISKSFYHYRIRNDSISHKLDREAVKKEFQLFSNIQVLFQKYCVIDKYAEILNLFLINHTIMGLERTTDNKFGINQYICEDVNILKNKRIIIYGAGKIGRSIYSELSRIPNIDIVLWVDKNYEFYNYECHRIAPPQEIVSREFDYVLIAIKNKELANAIKDDLVEKYRLSSCKILWCNPKTIY